MLGAPIARMLLACAAFALVSASCGSVAGSRSSASSARRPSVSVTRPTGSGARVVGDSPEAALLREVMSGVSPGVLESATLGGDPSVDPVDQAQIPAGATWVYFTVPTASVGQVTELKQDWLSSLVAGAYKDEAASQGFPHLDGYSIRGLSAGSVDPTVGGDFRIGLGASEPITDASPAALESEISDRLKTTPFKLVSFSVESPDRNAPVVVVQTNDSAAASGRIDLSSIFGDPFQYEGFYLQINNSAGKPVRIYEQSSRTQISAGWTDPGILTAP